MIGRPVVYVDSEGVEHAAIIVGRVENERDPGAREVNLVYFPDGDEVEVRRAAGVNYSEECGPASWHYGP